MACYDLFVQRATCYCTVLHCSSLKLLSSHWSFNCVVNPSLHHWAPARLKLNILQNCLECGGIIGRSLNAHIKVVSSGDILGWEGAASIKTSWENLLAHYLFNTGWQEFFYVYNTVLVQYLGPVDFKKELPEPEPTER